MDVCLHPFLTSSLPAGKWLVSQPSRFTSAKTGERVGHTEGVGALEKSNIVATVEHGTPDRSHQNKATTLTKKSYTLVTILTEQSHNLGTALTEKSHILVTTLTEKSHILVTTLTEKSHSLVTTLTEKSHSLVTTLTEKSHSLVTTLTEKSHSLVTTLTEKSHSPLTVSNNLFRLHVSIKTHFTI
jgi:hypothetical protein